jgi:hypothetical protein
MSFQSMSAIRSFTPACGAQHLFFLLNLFGLDLLLLLSRGRPGLGATLVAVPKCASLFLLRQVVPELGQFNQIRPPLSGWKLAGFIQVFSGALPVRSRLRHDLRPHWHYYSN